MKNQIEKILKDSIAVNELVLEKSLDQIQKIAQICIDCLKNNGKIIFCGNGGSAADSQHLVAELVVRFKKDRKSIPAMALSVNTSIITAIGNDYGYEKVFSRQIESLANKQDILIAISTSGKATNVREAIKTAKKIGLKTIAFTGKNGSDFAGLCDYSLIIPSENTARIQEAHITVGHIICELIEENLT